MRYISASIGKVSYFILQKWGEEDGLIKISACP
jgi:hypothetical protein